MDGLIGAEVVIRVRINGGASGGVVEFRRFFELQGGGGGGGRESKEEEEVGTPVICRRRWRARHVAGEEQRKNGDLFSIKL